MAAVNDNRKGKYTAEEMKKIAPGYRGKIENFDPEKMGKKQSPKVSKVEKMKTSREIPKPTQLQKVETPTPQKNNPMWADSIFGIDVSIRELDVNMEHTPTLARLPAIVEEVYSSIGGDDKNRGKSLTKEMMMYYTTALVWARLLDIKAKRGNANLSFEETEYCKLMFASEYNIPQPIYLMLKGLGHVKDKTGKTIFLSNKDLPVTVVQGRGGYPAPIINTVTHNEFEEIPSLGICGDILMAQSTGDGVLPDFKVLPPKTEATSNMVGYYGQMNAQKEEIRIELQSVGITGSSFKETVQSTRLNVHLVQKVSDYLSTIPTFREEKVKIDSLTCEGDSSQFIRTIPTDENTNAAIPWINKIVRPTAANAESTTTFGASYFTGYQLYKEPTNTDDHSNWCCVKAATAQTWTIPNEWIKNRNENRILPPGFAVNRFVSISDSQLVRTNAIVRRMIQSQR